MKLLLPLMLAHALMSQEVVTWKPETGHMYQNGRYLAYATNADGTSTVTTSSRVANGWIESTISISNSSEVAIDFFPGNCMMSLESTGRILGRFDPDRLAKWILNRDAVSLSLARISAANLGNPIYGDQKRAAEAWQNIRNWEATIQQEARSVLARAFRNETILPGRSVARLVYFETDKACARGCAVTLRVPVAGTTYEFPRQ